MGNKLLGDRIRTVRTAKGMTQGDIAEQIGVAISTVQRYEKGRIEKIKLPVVAAIARVLNVSPDWLAGKTDDMSCSRLSSGVTPLPPSKVPLVGQIACGAPILAEQNITDYVDLPGHIRADYALTCKGDSMVGAGIRDGDVVYIRQQEEVENGQIAAVVIDDEEATLKRFYYADGVVTLVPENSAYPPRTYVGDAISSVHVIGLAVAFTHAIVSWAK